MIERGQFIGRRKLGTERQRSNSVVHPAFPMTQTSRSTERSNLAVEYSARYLPHEHRASSHVVPVILLCRPAAIPAASKARQQKPLLRRYRPYSRLHQSPRERRERRQCGWHPASWRQTPNKDDSRTLQPPRARLTQGERLLRSPRKGGSTASGVDSVPGHKSMCRPPR